jgi:uncharacterized protein
VTFLVDTNVFIYAADRDAPDHAVCRKKLERWRTQRSPWYVTWGILYEFLRVVTHPQVLRRPWSGRQAWGFVDALLASPSLRVLEHTRHHARVVSESMASVPELRGNLFHDANTAFLMREHGVERIYTRDADFHRFAFLEVVDPVAER